MKKKRFIIKSIIALLIAGLVYLSFEYNFPYSARIKNEATYYINHNSNIKYTASNAWSNAKVMLQIISERIGE